MKTLGTVLLLLLPTMLLSGPRDPCQELEMLNDHVLTQIL